jgi:hypothetical protein
LKTSKITFFLKNLNSFFGEITPMEKEKGALHFFVQWASEEIEKV